MKLTVLVDNNTLIDRYYYGEPAVSYYIEDGDQRILWDTGYSDLCLTNAALLGISLMDLTTIAISHGHNDHTRGLEALCTQLDLSQVELVAHPLAFAPKRDDHQQPIGSPLTTQKLVDRCQMRFSDIPVKLSPHITFLGEIPHTLPYEPRRAIGQRLTTDGWIEDFLPDDTALVYESPLGLYIITACSHSGICNICEYAKDVTGDHRIRGIIGGFHLFGLSLQLSSTIVYFQDNHITDLYPCHCVDFTAKSAINDILPVNEVGVGLTLEW